MTLSNKTEQEKRRRKFERLADRRFAKIAKTSETIPWTEIRGYLEDRVAGKAPHRPVARKLGD